MGSETMPRHSRLIICPCCHEVSAAPEGERCLSCQHAGCQEGEPCMLRAQDEQIRQFLQEPSPTHMIRPVEETL